MKLISLLAAAFASTSAIPSAGPAPTMAVMGLDLGSTLTISECPYKKQLRRLAYESEYSSTNTLRPCFQVREGYLDNPGQPITTGTRKVRILLGDAAPRGVDWSRIEGTVIEGKLEALFVPTSGASSQEELLAQLLQKYGRPFDLTRETVQTRMGASYEAAYATWKFDNLLVIFTGMAGSISNGAITFATAAGDAHIAAEAAAKKAAAPKL